MNATPAPLRLYRGVAALASPLAGLLLRRRIRAGKEDAARAGERRGIAAAARPPGPLVWIHGASVGEVLAAAALIERLRDFGLTILLTSGTVTSAEIVARRFPPGLIHQYVPLDAPRFVGRFLDHWKPSLALFIESDLWPNLILAGQARRLPMVLINGRMSPRSFPRWQRFHATIAALLGAFELCLAQSDGDAARFAALGGRNVVATGNLKFDVPAPPADPVRLAALAEATAGRPVVVAASTHPGEDEIVLAMHRALTNFFPALLTVIVPRHAARGDEVAAVMTAGGQRVAMRSRSELPDAATDMYVADTMGELGLFYRLAPVVVMGGSFVPHGGQNPIEPIKLGAAIVHGPDVFNFPDVYAALDARGGALAATDPDMLVRHVGRFLANPGARRASVDAATQVVDELGGALDRTLAALEPYLMQLRLERGDA